MKTIEISARWQWCGARWAPAQLHSWCSWLIFAGIWHNSYSNSESMCRVRAVCLCAAQCSMCVSALPSSSEKKKSRKTNEKKNYQIVFSFYILWSFNLNMGTNCYCRVLWLRLLLVTHSVPKQTQPNEIISFSVDLCTPASCDRTTTRAFVCVHVRVHVNVYCSSLINSRHLRLRHNSLFELQFSFHCISFVFVSTYCPIHTCS